ncbi:hypothetical protein WQ54_19660 [Bacillus sp. SA1-12]|uniref:hypothetical protein n=1 Tax=Bacillus sp. SA1-12 TaxID=1455638 RepID=UPI00062724F1|nr:hypothetical protein [Bacillus sp. SA1-12]KKI90208.1 hypothetical protein WQ54_19660 [Bacillus sp. SA1-12]
MIFYACVKYDEQNPETYKGIEVTTLGHSQDVIASFNSYDPLQDYHNFVSWTESVGDDNVGFCDSLKHFAKDYEHISANDSNEMLRMVYGEHQDC